MNTFKTLTIGSRVLGTYGPGVITSHARLAGGDAAWVLFDSIPDDSKPCPLDGLNPLANYADMGGEACRFDADAREWVRS